MELEFIPFEKLSRMKRDCTITEKIDGTNAQIQFDEAGNMLVGSRKRQIWPEGTEDKPKGCDNMAFAQWAYGIQSELFATLGEGRHFGEWCGKGIQRNYGLDHKKFLLFNSARWGENRDTIPGELMAAGLGVVPQIVTRPFTTDLVDKVMDDLANNGSHLNGFNKPEGIVVYHHALRKSFKITFEHDRGKGPNNQSPA